ncbi:MAG: 2-amino-4-hydroxy-6-hydroxymethyldihydropteridine diphosphokinase [Pseudomonadota bacterium]
MILIALGANLPHPGLGPPPAAFAAALRLLEERGFISAARSRLYHNTAIGPGDQPDYVNAAAALMGAHDPPRIMAALIAVETALGRVRAGRWGPRTLDLDLIAVGPQVLPSRRRWRAVAKSPEADPRPRLVLPHPRAHQRAFVLAPLLDVAPRWRHPVLGGTPEQWLARLGREAKAFTVAPWP